MDSSTGNLFRLQFIKKKIIGAGRGANEKRFERNDW